MTSDSLSKSLLHVCGRKIEDSKLTLPGLAYSKQQKTNAAPLPYSVIPYLKPTDIIGFSIHLQNLIICADRENEETIEKKSGAKKQANYLIPRDPWSPHLGKTIVTQRRGLDSRTVASPVRCQTTETYKETI